MTVNIDGLEIACWLNWFTTDAGIAALIISIALAAIATIMSERKRKCDCGHISVYECREASCKCGAIQKL
jgi:hypothetical protein